VLYNGQQAVAGAVGVIAQGRTGQIAAGLEAGGGTGLEDLQAEGLAEQTGPYLTWRDATLPLVVK